YRECNATGAADERGRRSADRDCGADCKRRLYGGEWLREFPERALVVCAAGGICAEERGCGDGCADGDGRVSQPDGDAERDGGCAAGGVVVAGIRDDVCGERRGPEHGCADGNADQQWRGAAAHFENGGKGGLCDG